MTNTTVTKSLFAAAALTLGLATTAAHAAPVASVVFDAPTYVVVDKPAGAAAATAGLAMESVVFDAPTYVVVDKPAGAAAATAGLAMEEMVFEEGLTIRTSRPAVAKAARPAAAEVLVLVHR